MADTSTHAATASGLAIPGKPAARSAAATPSEPGAATTTPDIPLTAGLEQLDAAKITEAFMGLPVELEKKDDKPDTTKPEDETETETETEETDETETETEQTGDETESETETETEEETETATDTEETEGKSDLEKGLEKALGKDPKLKGLHKRIKGIFAQNKTLKTELETLKAERAETESRPAQVLAPGEADPLAHVTTQADLDTVSRDAEWWVEWCEDHPDGGTLKAGDGKEHELTVEQVRSQLRLAQRVLRFAPKRAEYLRKYEATAKAVGEGAKALTDPKAETREAKVVKLVPEILRDPEHLQLLADAKAGRELREKQAKGIKLVEVSPNKQGEKTKPGDKPKPAQAKAPEKPQPEPEAGEPLTEARLADLRARADRGDKKAQEELTNAFLS